MACVQFQQLKKEEEQKADFYGKATYSSNVGLHLQFRRYFIRDKKDKKREEKDGQRADRESKRRY